MKLHLLPGRSIRIITSLLGALVLLIALSLHAQAAFQQNGTAQVRVIHAAPGAGDVDVFVDGKETLTRFAFGTLTEYMPVPAGTHEIKIAPAGQGIDAAVITQTAEVSENDTYTVAALGTKEEGFSLQEFKDENKLENSNNAAIRVYHLSPNAGPVNIATGGNTVIEGLSYKNASQYLEVPPGNTTFDVTATNTNTTTQAQADLRAGTINSVLAVGLARGEPALKFVTSSVPEKHD